MAVRPDQGVIDKLPTGSDNNPTLCDIPSTGWSGQNDLTRRLMTNNHPAGPLTAGGTMAEKDERELITPRGKVLISRGEGGVPCIEGSSWESVYFGLGWAHARDRLTEIVMMHTIAEGRACEKLIALPELEATDTIFRKMNLANLLRDELQQPQPQDAETIGILESYSQGVNDYVATHLRPLELMLVRVRPPRWTPSHSLLIGKLMGYAGLAQGQEEVERFLIESIQRGVDRELLQSLLSPHLDGADWELIKKVRLRHIGPSEAKTPPRIIPAVGGSNNWVVSPRRSSSGFALFCNDPHLEINRLPPVWYEVLLTCGGDRIAGATFPGVPGVLIGRNLDLAFGVTYTMGDTTDFWIQECRGGRYLCQEGWHDFNQRQETIVRKRKPPLKLRFYDLPDGSVLEGEPSEDGFYLSLGWTARNRPLLPTMTRLLQLSRTKTVAEAMDLAGETTLPALNWVFADRQGNIGFQVGGSFPRRARGWSGLYPIPGWREENRWSGFLSAKELPRRLNPPEGWIATANNDTNEPGKPIIINLPLRSDRADRIGQVIQTTDRLTSGDMKRLQYDLFSNQAAQFFPLLEPCLDDSANADHLRRWDFCYETNSFGPSVFENIHREMLLTIFGEGGFGRPWLREILETTPIGETLSFYFDRTLLTQNSPWFRRADRESLVRLAVQRALNLRVERWGRRNTLTMANIFFNGRLPHWLGFDAGPFPIPGGRATVCQGNIFSFWGRRTSFAPSFRLVTDMGRPLVETNIPGGPSGRRFSRWYLSDLAAYFQGRYKRIYLENEDPKTPPGESHRQKELAEEATTTTRRHKKKRKR